LNPSICFWYMLTVSISLKTEETFVSISWLNSLSLRDARNMSRSLPLQCKNLFYPIETKVPCPRAYPKSCQFRSQRRYIFGMRKDRENTRLEYTTWCIFDLRAFEIWILLRAHLDFKCCGPQAPVTRLSRIQRARSSPGHPLHPLSPLYYAIVHRQRGPCRSVGELPRLVPSISG